MSEPSPTSQAAQLRRAADSGAGASAPEIDRTQSYGVLETIRTFGSDSLKFGTSPYLGVAKMPSVAVRSPFLVRNIGMSTFGYL
jgi:hypothetical protein